MLFLGMVAVEIKEMAAVQEERLVLRRARVPQKRPKLLESLAQIAVLSEQLLDEARPRMA